MRRSLVTVTLAGAVSFVVSGTTIAFGTHVAGHGAAAAGGSAGVRVASSADGGATSATTYQDVPDLSTTVSVPNAQKHLLLARFHGVSQCDVDALELTDVVCYVRILVDGMPAQPAAGITSGGHQYDTKMVDWDEGGDHLEAHAIERWAVVSGGAHEVKVQFRVGDADTHFSLINTILVVEQFPVPPKTYQANPNPGPPCFPDC